MHRRLGRFHETYRGSSFPTRGETADGEVCVIKLRGAGNGSTALLSEFLVNRLASRADLAVPDVFILEIADGHPWDFGTDEYYDLVRKSAGPNLALRFVEGAKPLAVSLYGCLPKEIISQVVTIDLTFGNLDRSFQSANLLRDDRGGHWIIDHGSCRFLFQQHARPAKGLPTDHVFAGTEKAFDRSWVEKMSAPALISDTVSELPDAWLADVRLSRHELVFRIQARLKSALETKS
jgi:hypothetical protein